MWRDATVGGRSCRPEARRGRGTGAAAGVRRAVPADLMADIRIADELKTTVNVSEARATICGRTALLARVRVEALKASV